MTCYHVTCYHVTCYHVTCYHVTALFPSLSYLVISNAHSPHTVPIWIRRLLLPALLSTRRQMLVCVVRSVFVVAPPEFPRTTAGP